MKTRQLRDEVKLRTEAAVWRQLDDEVMLLALETSTYLQLNDTAAVLWSLIVEGTTRSALVSELVSRFNVTPERAADDVDLFLNSCRRQRLLA